VRRLVKYWRDVTGLAQMDVQLRKRLIVLSLVGRGTLSCEVFDPLARKAVRLRKIRWRTESEGAPP